MAHIRSGPSLLPIVLSEPSLLRLFLPHVRRRDVRSRRARSAPSLPALADIPLMMLEGYDVKPRILQRNSRLRLQALSVDAKTIEKPISDDHREVSKTDFIFRHIATPGTLILGKPDV